MTEYMINKVRKDYRDGEVTPPSQATFAPIPANSVQLLIHAKVE